MSALQPYRGKPAVRNDRGDRGNVGIIRSPIRASILPDCGRSCAKSGHYKPLCACVDCTFVNPNSSRRRPKKFFDGRGNKSVRGPSHARPFDSELSSGLLISQDFSQRSVPNRHLQGALRTKRFFKPMEVPTLWRPPGRSLPMSQRQGLSRRKSESPPMVQGGPFSRDQLSSKLCTKQRSIRLSLRKGCNDETREGCF
jgi:hypothetical protein